MSIYKSGRPHKYNPLTKSGTKPPQKPGEYRIRDESDKIVYVGETNNLLRRMNEHCRSGKMSNQEGRYTFEWKVADGRSTSATRREHERKKIEEHAPKMNRSKGGEGRRAVKTKKKKQDT